MRGIMTAMAPVALLLAATAAQAAIKTKTIDYKQGETALKGFLAYDDALQGRRPGVLVVPEWWGQSDYVHKRAEQLAGLGYVAFAVDMYGDAKSADTPEEAGKLATPLMTDRALMRARVLAGLDVLKADEHVDAQHIAAIGFCFGGTTVLELARSGADIKGVVCFHGGLATPNPADAKNIKAKVLVLNGGDDAFVPPEQVAAFEKEMRDGGVDWQVVLYGGAVHAFTNPDADKHHMKNVAYNADADRRSWQAMRDFFAEIFK